MTRKPTSLLSCVFHENAADFADSQRVLMDRKMRGRHDQFGLDTVNMRFE